MKAFSTYLEEKKKCCNCSEEEMEEKKKCHCCEGEDDIDEMAIKHRGDQADHLDDELEMIEDTNLRGFIEEYLDKQVPEYFWSEAGAKRAGHHPDQDLGEGGLIRHTRMCVHVADELLRSELFSNVADKHDVLIGALICHDTKKNGNENDRYAFDHPTHAANSIKKFYRDKYEGEKSAKLEDDINFMAKTISSHMGQWNTGYGKDKNVVLPKPSDPYDSFVHLCDYIASRMFIGNLDHYNKK